MLTDHAQKAPNKEFIVAADINLYLFKDTVDDKGTIIKRELRPGVFEVLDEHDLVLTVPSGQSEISRASIQDQLHKITSSKRPKSDSLIVLQKRHKKIHSIKQMTQTLKHHKMSTLDSVVFTLYKTLKSPLAKDSNRSPIYHRSNAFQDPLHCVVVPMVMEPK